MALLTYLPLATEWTCIGPHFMQSVRDGSVYALSLNLDHLIFHAQPSLALCQALYLQPRNKELILEALVFMIKASVPDKEIFQTFHFLNSQFVYILI